MKSNQSPYKILLNKQENGLPQQRTAQQIEILVQLIQNNCIFEFLKIDKQIIKEISSQILLIWTDHPHSITVLSNQIYLILDGAAFQYIENKQAQNMKSKIYNSNTHIFIRKIGANQFFYESQLPRKYTSNFIRKKYQYMVDGQTLLGKISTESFAKIFWPALQERQKNIIKFCKKVGLINSLPNQLFNQLSRYLTQESYLSGQKIIDLGEKNAYVFFIKEGAVQFKVFQKNRTQSSLSKRNSTTQKPIKQFHKETLKVYDSFGLQNFIPSNEHIQTQQQATVIKDCQLFKIQKRILAIIISIITNNQSRIVSSINLNDQIVGQSQRDNVMSSSFALSQNARSIKSFEKKIRDAKLKMLASRKTRVFEDKQDLRNLQKQRFELTQYRSQSCHNIYKKQSNFIDSSSNLYKNEDNTYFSQRLSLNSRSQFRKSQRQIIQISHILVQPDMDEFIFTDHSNGTEQKINELNSMIPKPKVFSSNQLKKRKDLVSKIKQQKKPLINFLSNKLNKQMLKKANLILERNAHHRFQPMIKTHPKSNNDIIKRTRSQQKTRISMQQQYNYRISKINDNPLLDLVSSGKKNQKIKSSTKIRSTTSKNFRSKDNKYTGLMLLSKD